LYESGSELGLDLIGSVDPDLGRSNASPHKKIVLRALYFLKRAKVIISKINFIQDVRKYVLYDFLS
jgi:hypothetical protein